MQQFHQFRAPLTQEITLDGGGTQGIVGNGDAEFFLQIVTETTQLRAPHLLGIGQVGALGQVEHINFLAAPHQFVHFLLSIAGGFSHDQIGKIGVGTFVTDIKTVTGFDERAEIFGQIPLGGGDGFGAHTAQTDGDNAGGVEDLKGRKGTEIACYFASGFLGVLHLQKAGLAAFTIFFECLR